MDKFIKFFIVLFLLQIFSVFSAETEMKQVKSESSSNILSLQKKLDSLETQVLVLNTKLSQSEESSKSILGVVNNALIGIGGILVIIIGMNFVQGYNLNTNKLNSIQVNLSATQDTKISEISSSLFDSLLTRFEKDSKEIENFSKELITSESLKISDILNEYLDEHKKIVTDKIESQTEKTSSFGSNVKKLENNLKKYTSDITEKVDDLKREVLIIRADKFKENRKMGYIHSYIDVLDLDVKRGWDFRTTSTLDSLHKALNDGYYDIEILNDLDKSLNKVPNSHKIQVNNIREKMAELSEKLV